MSFKPILINDHFQNHKRYNIPKAQLIIADIPYNIGKDAYGFEIKKDFYNKSKELVLSSFQKDLFA